MASVKKRIWTYKGEEKTAWVVRWKEGTTHKSKQFERQKEAKSFHDKLTVESVEGGRPISRVIGTVEELCRAYYASRQQAFKDGRLSPSHMRVVRTAYDLHVIPHIGDLKLLEVVPRDIDGLYQQIRMKKTQSGLIGHTHAWYCLYYLKQAFEYAIQNDYLRKNVVQTAMKTIGGRKLRVIRVPKIEDMHSIFRVVEQQQPGRKLRPQHLRRLFVYLGALCGLRYGEIIGLQRRHVDLVNGVIEVRHSMCRDRGLKGPKTASGVRDVPMPARVGQLLGEWYRDHFVENPDDLVFFLPEGQHGYVRTSNWHSSYWKPLLRDAGVATGDGDEFHFHALRHFAASYMLEHGFSLQDTASLLGHAKFDVTLQVYAHPIVGGHRRGPAMDAMASSLGVLPRCITQEIRTDL